MIEKKSILITGVNGFVGTNFRSYLKGTMFSELSLSRNELEFVDSNKINELSSFAIVHLAGLAHDLSNISIPEKYFLVNTGLTIKIFDAFLASDAKVFIFISSVKAVVDNCDGILTENYIPDPKTYYGKSKLMAEEYIQNQVLPNGKSFYILRPCMIHGPGNKGNLNLLYKLVSKGIPYPLAAFENKRSFLSVENLCFVIRELLERDNIPSGVYHIADDEALSTNDLIRLISLAEIRKAKLWKISPALIRSLAKLGDLLKLPLTTERLNKLTENYIVDNAKIKNALGKGFPVKASDGIIKTIKSFQNPNLK